MTKMTKRQALRLVRVKGSIRAEPRSYDQSVFRQPSPRAPCGTLACIGGHLVWNSLGARRGAFHEMGPEEINRRGKELLGVPKERWVWLFSATWSIETMKPLGQRYRDARTPEKRAEVAFEAIDLYLAERGRGPDGELLAEGR